MSNTTAWKDRLAKHRYSQDERALQWKFEKEVGPKIEAFLDNTKEQTFAFGTYNLETEPWRMAAALSFRKYNLKILETDVQVDAGDAKQSATEITLVKQKLSKTLHC